MSFDWHEFHASEAAAPAVVDSRRRMRICLAAFALLLLVVFGRAVQLEVTQGAAFRAKAVEPVRRETSVPGLRGRILARDGTVLAEDRRVQSLAVDYRRLEQRDLQRRLAELCGVSSDEWNHRTRRIQNRVERIAESVKRRRPEVTEVAEQRARHVVAGDIPSEAVERIRAGAEQYPGVEVVEQVRRVYPAGSLAAHLVGHLGRVGRGELEGPGAAYHHEDVVGRAGLERRYEPLLRGRRGTRVEPANHSGELLRSFFEPAPGTGCDLILTIDPALQRAAEELLDAALKQRAVYAAKAEPAGGAVVVIDVRSGALLAVASAPRFDPNWFLGGDPERLAGVMNAASHPLFDRTVQMAIAPGAVFTPVTAAALIESQKLDPDAEFFCRGYLHEPDSRRCAVYRRHGTGHGEVTLADALAKGCNVYFFHHGTEMGPGPLVDWASRFGFGRPAGVDLPGEAAGTVPTAATVRRLEGRAWRPGDTQSLSIGQGSLAATPLQVARLTAAVANGGRLVTPHVVERFRQRESADEGSPVAERPVEIPPPQPIAGLRPSTLAAIRRGLEQSVSDPGGAAHGTVYLEGISIAGKTSTVATGPDRADHAWFAGYVPAGHPQYGVVVALEHSAATAVGPIAKRLVIQMEKLGILRP